MPKSSIRCIKNALKTCSKRLLSVFPVDNLVHLGMLFWNPLKALKNLDYDYKAVNLLKSEQLEDEYKCKQSHTNTRLTWILSRIERDGAGADAGHWEIGWSKNSGLSAHAFIYSHLGQRASFGQMILLRFESRFKFSTKSTRNSFFKKILSTLALVTISEGIIDKN